MLAVGAGSNPAENQQNDNYEKDQPETAGRGVAPFSTVRPPWQRAEKRQNQNYDQDGSKHICSFFPSVQRRARAQSRPRRQLVRRFIVSRRPESRLRGTKRELPCRS